MSSNSYGESPGERATDTITVRYYTTPGLVGSSLVDLFQKPIYIQKDGSMNDCEDKTKEPRQHHNL